MRTNQHGNGRGVNNLMHEALDKVWARASELGLAGSVQCVSIRVGADGVRAISKLTLVLTEVAVPEPVPDMTVIVDR